MVPRGAGGVTDGSKAYRAAIDAHLGHATHFLDRFHVIGWFAAGLTAVRRDVQRRQPAGQLTLAFEPDIFAARFTLLRRADTLSPPPDRQRLEELFCRHPRLRARWAALAALHGAYTAGDKQAALAAIMAFADLYDPRRPGRRSSKKHHAADQRYTRGHG